MGSGAKSRVFSAWDIARGRPAVVTVLPAPVGGEAAARVRREMRLVAGVQHPHIVPVFEAGEAGGLPYYATAFIDGESLRARLDRDGCLDSATASRVLGEVAGALAYMHRHGLVHGDVGAESIFLEFETGRVLLADFGVGGKALVDARNDLYRLGLVGREMVGRDVAPGIGAAIERALSKDPAARWPTGDDFAAQLRSVERGSLGRRVSQQGQQVVERVRASGAWAVGRGIIDRGLDLAARVRAQLRVHDAWPGRGGVVSRVTWLVAGGAAVLLLLGDGRAPVSVARATPAFVTPAFVAPAFVAPAFATQAFATVVGLRLIEVPPAVASGAVDGDVVLEDAMGRVYHQLQKAFEPGARRELGHAQEMWEAGRDRVCHRFTRPDARARCQGELSRRRVTELTELLARVRGQGLAHPAGSP